MSTPRHGTHEVATRWGPPGTGTAPPPRRFYHAWRARAPPLYLPPRPPHYNDEFEHLDASVVPVDRFFQDEVAQELMTHPKLQAAFQRMHGMPMEERPALMAALVEADAELAELLAMLKQCAGDSVSVARGEPSAEELRVARYVHTEPAA